MIFNPFTLIFFFVLFFFLLFAFVFINIGLITVAFSKIGFSPHQVFMFLLISLLGSHINLPIKRLKGVRTEKFIISRHWGLVYRIPPKRIQKGTLIAVNVGGALLPLMVSIMLMMKWGLFFQPIIGIVIVAMITYFFARPIAGVGIALPLFIAPLFAVVSAILISPGELVPVVAYISGTIGTLLGADILHLKDIKKLKAPLVSIGGAGTFDGIFLTGIISVLIA